MIEEYVHKSTSIDVQGDIKYATWHLFSKEVYIYSTQEEHIVTYVATIIAVLLVWTIILALTSYKATIIGHHSINKMFVQSSPIIMDPGFISVQKTNTTIGSLSAAILKLCNAEFITRNVTEGSLVATINLSVFDSSYN